MEGAVRRATPRHSFRNPFLQAALREGVSSEETLRGGGGGRAGLGGLQAASTRREGGEQEGHQAGGRRLGPGVRAWRAQCAHTHAHTHTGTHTCTRTRESERGLRWGPVPGRWGQAEPSLGVQAGPSPHPPPRLAWDRPSGCRANLPHLGSHMPSETPFLTWTLCPK